MPIDNLTWHARVGMVYALKPLLKSKSSTKNFSELFSLTFILRTILLYLNNVHLFFNCILIKNATTYLRLLTELPKMTKIAILLLFSLRNLLFCCGNFQVNSGPKSSSLTFCHWNLDGLTAHNSIKILLLQACVTRHNYDIICLSETFLKSSIEPTMIGSR